LKKVPNHTSNTRHSFKSYKIPRLFELLERCSHLESSEPHKKSAQEAKNSKAKESYYKQFMEACKTLAIEEASKEASEQAPIPKSVAELLKSAPVEDNSQYVIIIDGEASSKHIEERGNTPQNSSIQTHNEPVANQHRADAVTHIAEGNASSETTQGKDATVNRDGDKNVGPTADAVDTEASTHTADGNASSGATQAQGTAVNRDGEGNVDSTADVVDNEASFGNDFQEQDDDWSSQEINEDEAIQASLAQDAVESTSNNEKTAMDQESRSNSHADYGTEKTNDTETSGESRISSSSESPSPKRLLQRS
jgi:hypothetical protein